MESGCRSSLPSSPLKPSARRRDSRTG